MTEIENDWLHSRGKSLRNLILLSNLDFIRYKNIFLCEYFGQQWDYLKKKKKKKSNEYDDVNEEGIRSIFLVPVLR